MPKDYFLNSAVRNTVIRKFYYILFIANFVTNKLKYALPIMFTRCTPHNVLNHKQTIQFSGTGVFVVQDWKHASTLPNRHYWTLCNRQNCIKASIKKSPRFRINRFLVLSLNSPKSQICVPLYNSFVKYRTSESYNKMIGNGHKHLYVGNWYFHNKPPFIRWFIGVIRTLSDDVCNIRLACSDKGHERTFWSGIFAFMTQKQVNRPPGEDLHLLRRGTRKSRSRSGAGVL